MSEYTLQYMFCDKQQDSFKHFSFHVDMMLDFSAVYWREGGTLKGEREGGVGSGGVRTSSGACPSHELEHDPTMTWEPLPPVNSSASLSVWKPMPHIVCTQHLWGSGSHTKHPSLCKCTYSLWCSQHSGESIQSCTPSLCESLCNQHTWGPGLPLALGLLLPYLHSRGWPVVYPESLDLFWLSWIPELLYYLVAELYIPLLWSLNPFHVLEYWIPSFHYGVDEMPKELNSCWYQLTFGKVSSILHCFT